MKAIAKDNINATLKFLDGDMSKEFDKLHIENWDWILREYKAKDAEEKAGKELCSLVARYVKRALAGIVKPWEVSVGRTGYQISYGSHPPKKKPYLIISVDKGFLGGKIEICFSPKSADEIEHVGERLRKAAEALYG
jgi:hypothetical protein